MVSSSHLSTCNTELHTWLCWERSSLADGVAGALRGKQGILGMGCTSGTTICFSCVVEDEGLCPLRTWE